RAALTPVRRREASDRQPWQVDRLEFETLAPVDRHKTDRVYVQRADRDLPQVALFGEKHQLAHPVERTSNRKTRARRTHVADEVHELPHGDRAHSIRDRLAPRQFSGGTRAVE